MIAGFDFTFGKFGKGNMTVLQESKAFNTTIVGKQEMDSENFYNCNTPSAYRWSFTESK